MATQFFYTAAAMMRRAGRSSPNAAAQIVKSMPVPDAVGVSGVSSRAWTLDSWRRFAVTRSKPLSDDLLRTIEELQSEELELMRRYSGSDA